MLRCRAVSALPEAGPLERRVPDLLGNAGHALARVQGERQSDSGEMGRRQESKKETTKEWVRFLQDKQNFPSGGVPASEPGAPSLAAFQAWIGKAAA